MKSISKKKKIATIWFKSLRDEICNEFLNLEKKTSKKKIRFTKKKWNKSKKKSEGGGEMTLLRNGNIFEKVGVNISEVSGKFDEKAVVVYIVFVSNFQQCVRILIQRLLIKLTFYNGIKTENSAAIIQHQLFRIRHFKAGFERIDCCLFQNIKITGRQMVRR